MGSLQRGQALPLGLALLLVGSLGALVLFNTGMVATDKARLANTADAAAYSGLVWQARALNFQAYTNRAMVANQVTMAQAVSLNSWASYGSMAAERLAAVTGAIPGVNVLTRGVEAALTTIDSVIDPLSSAVVSVVDVVNSSLGGAQEAMFASSFGATPDIVRKVAMASDPRFTSDTAYSLAGMSSNLRDWSNFTESVRVDDVPAMRERADVIMQSRDDFSRKRYWEFFDNFWMYSTVISRHKVYREGDTRLVSMLRDGQLHWEWRAVDTLAVQTRIWRPLRSERKHELPIAWGGAHANSDGSSNSILEALCDQRGSRTNPDCDYWVTKNDGTERLAHRASDTVHGYTGVRAFRTLSETMRTLENHDPVLKLRTEVALPIVDVRSSTRSTTGEDFDVELLAPGDKLSSISVAEVYYRRPEYGTPNTPSNSGSDALMEAANGYNPYWTVRLAPVELEERLIAVGMRLVEGVGSSTPDSQAGRATHSLSSYSVLGESTEANAGQLPVDPIGSTTGLPGYGGTLADVYGVSGASTAGLVAERSSLTAQSIEGFQRMDDPVGFMTGELDSALRSAATNIARGLFQQGEAVVRGEGERILAEVPDAGELLTITDEARVYAADMLALRDNVSADFEPTLNRLMTGHEAQVAGLERLVLEARRQLVGSHGESRSELQSRIELLEGEISTHRTELIERLAEELVLVTRRHAPAHMTDPLHIRTAREMVIELLRAIAEGDVDDARDFFPWGN